MEEVVSRKKCTGCTACVNSCPVHAIEMKKDKNGFEYPVINQEKCLNCGLCQKVCPVINTENNKALNKCYVGYSKKSVADDKSSSGGIFSILANSVLEKNGIVVGAAFDEKHKLLHIAIDKEEELEKLKGSKYLQSSLGNIFEYIKQNLENKNVLFVGTPCQVAGLKSFLKKDYENLLTIDLVCHGVPSPKIFEKYIAELEERYNDKLVSYNFRDKTTGWDTYSNTATLNNTTLKELRTQNDYMRLFLSDIALRECCYDCNFKLGNKYSDITLGDFWGIMNHYPEMYSKNGVSAIIINTQKGENAFNSIKEQTNYKECKLDEITSGNGSLTKSSEMPLSREKFFEQIDTIKVKKLAKMYGKKTSFLNKAKKKIKRLLKK